jgi:hypothetical protein
MKKVPVGIVAGPAREAALASNAWAFLLWVNAMRGMTLDGWNGLQRFSATDPEGFCAAIVDFAALGGQMTLPPSAGLRIALAGALANALLHDDIRPDDRVLVAAAPGWPMFGDASPKASLSRYAGPPERLAAVAAGERASVVIAPAAWQQMVFGADAHTHDFAALRLVVLLGGPWSPDIRNRVHTGTPHGLQLRARDADTLWGNPLEAGLDAGPGWFRPPA